MSSMSTQYLSDRIRAARTGNGTGWLTHDDVRYHITTDTQQVEALDCIAQMAFVRCKRGIRLDVIHRHDGGRIRSLSGRYMNDSDVLALVLDSHKRT